MKPILKFIIVLTGSFAFISCNKKDDAPALQVLPSNATINFHIKDTNTSALGEPVFLYRLIFTPTANYYDSSQNISLRPNIDTSFMYAVAGNTTNLFTVGGPPFDGVIIYKEHKFLQAGSSVDWEIIY